MSVEIDYLCGWDVREGRRYILYRDIDDKLWYLDTRKIKLDRQDKNCLSKLMGVKYSTNFPAKYFIIDTLKIPEGYSTTSYITRLFFDIPANNFLNLCNVVCIIVGVNQHREFHLEYIEYR